MFCQENEEKETTRRDISTCSACNIVILFLYSLDIVYVDVKEGIGIKLEALHAGEGEEARRIDEAASLSYGRRGMKEDPLSQQDALPDRKRVHAEAVDELGEVPPRAVQTGSFRGYRGAASIVGR